MPLYEYECDSCGNRFERIQKFSDPPIDKCPQCGGVVRKLISSPAIQFKGSGWYITDYARKAEKPDAAANADGSKSASETPASAPGGEGSSPKASKESKEAAKEPAASPKPAEKSTPGSNS
jgi:putative FmdB family regulatory protein